MVSIMVSRLRCLGQSDDQGHCDLHTGVYMDAAIYGKVHVSDPNFYGRGKTHNCFMLHNQELCTNLLNN